MQGIGITQHEFRNLSLSFRIYFFHLLNVHSVHFGFLNPVAATAVKSLIPPYHMYHMICTMYVSDYIVRLDHKVSI